MKNPPNKPEKSNGYTVSGLLKYIDHVLDDVAHQSRNLYADKYIRTELATAYHETKKYVEKIRAECPGIKDVPADSTDPKEYLRNAHTWCVGQFYWKDGERISVEKATAASASKEPAETEQESLQEIIEVLKNWQESEKTQKDLEEAKQALSPLSETHEILCEGKDFSRKTKKALQWLDMVADGKEGFCRALLNELASPEVIADLEKWQEKLAETEQDTREGGDTYIANQMSFGDNAQHAGRDISEPTPEPKKKWQKWVIIFAAIATILVLLFGDNIWGRISKRIKGTKPTVKQIETPKVSGNYKIEFIELKAVDLLNDGKDDEFWLQLFDGKEIGKDQKPIYNIQDTIDEDVNYKNDKFEECFKETSITVRLYIKDKDEMIQIDDDKSIDLKGNHVDLLKFKKHYPKLFLLPRALSPRMVRYSLEYGISQKGGS